jgi:cardiolipin synthase
VRFVTVFMPDFSNLWPPVLTYLLTLLLLIPWVLLHKSRNPVSTAAWIVAIILLPIVGGLMFAVFGINRVERRRSEKLRASGRLGKHLPSLSQHQLIPGEEHGLQHSRLMHLACRVSETLATTGNNVEILPDTNQTLGLIEQAILAAEETVHLEYYIWRPDRTGKRLRDLLIRKAKEGVTIRFLYDGIGSMHLNNRFLRPMRDAGIQVASFLPGATFRERWSINLRNHRKIVIVDGRVGFTGGMNIGDEYLGRNPQLGYWRDTHLKLVGPTVLQLQQVFVEDWCFATGEELTQPRLFPAPDSFGRVCAQVVPGAPTGRVSALHSLMFAAINDARESVTLATSYFVPTTSLLAALETAALRGVRVRLLVAGRSAYFWTVLAGRSYYESLLRAGVEIHEYERGLMHAKTLTIDGDWSLVGTANFDARSLMLNFEVSVALYDAKVAKQLEAHFEEDIQHAERIDAEVWQLRSRWRVLGENVCRMFAPVL